MKLIERKVQEIGEFFSRDILSFAILVCLGIFLVNHLASAQSLAKTPNSNVLKMKPRKFIEDRSSGSLSKQVQFHNEQSKKNWQLNLGLNAAQKAVNDGTQKDQNSSEYSFSTESSFKFSNEMSLKALLNYSSYTKNELQNDFSDLLVSFYFMKTKLGSNLNFKPYLLSTLPISKDSRQRQQMNLGYGAGASLSNQRGMMAGSLTSAGSLSFQKYSHKFETALNSTINTSHSANQQISLGWEYKQIGLLAMFRHINSWNYSNAMKESFFHLQAISWNINNNLSFSAGLSNSGNVLSANQEDVEIRLIDDNNSTLFASTNYIF
jgi:hypothetical protein